MQLFCRSTFQPNLIHGRPSPKPTAPLTHNENMSLSLFSRTPALDGNDTEASRARILAHFHQTFDRYEQLFEVLACDEAYFKKPIALRHPLIFYFGHTATFFINKLLLVGLVLVGGGKPALPRGARLDLDLQAYDRFDNGVVHLRYAVRNPQ